MKYALATLFTLAAMPALAATSISTTLTMTSPSAVISMTGVSATAYLTNVSATNMMADNVTSTLINGAIINTSNTVFARAYITTTGSGTNCTVLESSYNIASCSRTAAGEYGISLTTPRINANYRPLCGGSGNGNTFWWIGQLGSASPTVAGFRIKAAAYTGATLVYNDMDYADCVIY